SAAAPRGLRPLPGRPPGRSGSSSGRASCGTHPRMSLYPVFLEVKKLLAIVPAWLDKAAEHAAAKQYDPTTLLHARLAPSMFPLVRQARPACDQANYAAGRTTGKDIPSHPDTEQTFDELRKRVTTVLAYLEGFTARDFEGADTRSVSLQRWEGKSISGTN